MRALYGQLLYATRVVTGVGGCSMSVPGASQRESGFCGISIAGNVWCALAVNRS